MNKNTYRLVFNKSRGCMMAVLETASSSSKSPSATSKARHRLSKCSKTAKSDGVTLSNVPPAQWIRVQAAPIFLVDSGITYAKAFNLRPGIALSVLGFGLAMQHDSRKASKWRGP